MIQDQPHSDLLTCAIDLTMVRRWCIVPLNSVRDGRCTCGHPDCGNPAKHPRTKHGLNDGSDDPDQAWWWWEKWPDANIGLCTGSRSGIVGIDEDGPIRAASIAAMEALNEPLPETLTVQTGRAGGGRHLYFSYAGNDIRNVTDTPDKPPGPLGRKVDVRGEGGYLVTFPSVHITGRRYHAVDEAAPIAPLPVWLRTLLLKPKPAAIISPITTGGIGHDALMTWARRYCAKVKPPQPGARDNTLFNVAGHLWALRGEHGESLCEGEIVALLTGVNLLCPSPLPEKTIIEKVRSAAKNGTPREIKTPETHAQSQITKSLALRAREVPDVR